MRIWLLPVACVVMANNWVVDYPKSALTFEAVQEGKPFTGTLAFDSDITFEPDTLKDTDIIVNILLAQTDAGTTERNETLLTEAFFNINQFPAATFKTTDVTKSENGFVAKGTLTINGISKPLDLPFTLTDQQDRTLVKGEADISRKDFNVGTGDWADEATLGDKVTVKLNLIVRKK
jgi:polyisoprenoid-binding protein YceI